MRNCRVTAIAALLLLGACGGEKTERDPSTPSGYVVPRYLVLKYDEVNARSGPSEEHRKVGTYKALGMPVQVIAETKDWRRICDPLGEVAWVAARMLDGRRAVLRTQAGAIPIRRSPKPDADSVASLPERGRAELVKCEGDWCRVRARAGEGWVRKDEVWGAAEGQQCEGLPAPAPQPRRRRRDAGSRRDFA